MPALDFSSPRLAVQASGATGGIGRGASSDGAHGRAEDGPEDGSVRLRARRVRTARRSAGRRAGRGQGVSRRRVGARTARHGLIGEESAAEPRAKKATPTGRAARRMMRRPILASMASNPAPFPWTLPLNPSLWNIETVQVDGESASETGEGIDGDSVIGAATAAIADGAAGACLATLPGAGTDAKASTAFTIRVDAPIAVNPAGATIGRGHRRRRCRGVGERGRREARADAIDTFAWTGAAASGRSRSRPKPART